MTFDEVVGQVLGINFQFALVYLDESDSTWKVSVVSPAVTHNLSASTRGDAETEAAAWILDTRSRRVISVWVYSGSDFGGSKAVYA